MAFTYGFYNSSNHDRLYDAIQLSKIFDGLIQDGVYESVGDRFIVKTSEDPNTISVSTGRAWFNHTWNYNDSSMFITLDSSELLTDRIDAIVLDINTNDLNRENAIIVVKGNPGFEPERPELIKSIDHNQYPLAYILRKANTNIINQQYITNMVGTSECPFVTGLLEQTNIDSLLLQWADQWDQFVIEYEQGAIDWLDSIKEILDENAAVHLQNEIEALNEKEFNRYYGLDNSNTVIDKATGTITTNDENAKSITTIERNANETTITTRVIPVKGKVEYIKTTVIIKNSSETVITNSYNRKLKGA